MIDHDLAVQPRLQLFGALVVKAAPAHIDRFDLAGRGSAQSLIVAVASHQIVFDHALQRRQADGVGAREVLAVDVEHQTIVLKRQLQPVASALGADGLDGKTLEARPKSEGDGANVKRNKHHIDAVGIGDPQIYAGQAGTPKFKVGDAVTVRELPVIFYTRTPEYVRGATGRIAVLAYESPAPEDETWDIPEAPPEWFYVVEFNQSELWHDYTGTAQDTLRTEIPERWLEAAT